MKSTRLLPVLALLALAFALPGCGTLDPAGAYQNNLTLYRADSAITSAYTILHAFVSFEYQNRALLASQPEIKKAADNVRLHARDWISSAIALREAYAANPTTDNKSKLDAAVAILNAALTEATKYVNQGVPGAPAPATSP